LISENLKQVQTRIIDACLNANRLPSDVNLLAVSKTKPIEDVARAMEAGQCHFGENYLQDAIPKIQALPHARWHFIGQIQSNKTRDIAAHFDFVHGLASEKIATRLNAHRTEDKAPLGVFIQINLASETSKGGLAPEALPALVDHIRTLSRLEFMGLMALPPQSFGQPARRDFFITLRQLLDQLPTDPEIDRANQLSMGMSDDLETAIASGATWVRIGTAIFGARSNNGETL
jgi:pyridoxal phosphate enzyme (YggS family)